jgi:hypothetical protein
MHRLDPRFSHDAVLMHPTCKAAKGFPRGLMKGLKVLALLSLLALVYVGLQGSFGVLG